MAKKAKAPKEQSYHWPPKLLNPTHLEAFRAKLLGDVAQRIHAAGLDDRFLYALHLIYSGTDSEQSLATFKKKQKDIEAAAKDLERADVALRFLSELRLPYDPEEIYLSAEDWDPDTARTLTDVRNSFRVPTRDEASNHLADLKATAVRFTANDWRNLSKHDADTWRRVQAMTDGEYFADYVAQAAGNNWAYWAAPFSLPRVLIGRLAGRVDHDISGSTEMDSIPMLRLAELIGMLAHQARKAAGRISRGPGRQTEFAQRSFRERFDEYAMATTGLHLDAIGARLFGLTFGTVSERDYARQRRLDADGGKQIATTA